MAIHEDDRRVETFSLGITRRDKELWWWVKEQAQKRRMHISQFVMLCIEEKKKRDG